MIISSTEYLLNTYCVLSIVLDITDTSVSRMFKDPILLVPAFSWERNQRKTRNIIQSQLCRILQGNKYYTEKKGQHEVSDIRGTKVSDGQFAAVSAMV